VGYVWERTFDRILKSVTEARPDGEAPWVATLPARLVDYGPLSELFSGYGLVTEKLSTRTFPQRCFADAAERDHALRELAKVGVDPAGKEEEGWYHADLYLSRPAGEVSAAPVDELFGASGVLDYCGGSEARTSTGTSIIVRTAVRGFRPRCKRTLEPRERRATLASGSHTRKSFAPRALCAKMNRLADLRRSVAPPINTIASLSSPDGLMPSLYLGRANRRACTGKSLPCWSDESGRRRRDHTKCRWARRQALPVSRL
jgi:hypothetical protein